MTEQLKTIEECKATIQEFADRFNLTFVEEGECGFGRECVGLLRDDIYVAFNPYNTTDYECIPEFYSQKHYEITPDNAYHKHDCLAVLGRGDEAIRELAGWVEKLNENGAVVERYKTGATGIQAMLTGAYGYAVKLKP